MSNRAIDAVRDFSPSKGSERLLLFMIAEGINKSSGTYEAKISTLMDDCNMSERWVQKLIGQLNQSGQLIIMRRTKQSSSFAIPVYEGEIGYAPRVCTSKAHICTGFHTPLSVNRETIRREEWAEQRRIQRHARRRVHHNAPIPNEGERECTLKGERECTLEVNGNAPPYVTPILNPFVETPSLAPQAPVSTPREIAPPERRTRESDFDQTALRRDPLTLTLIACLGHEPATRREWGQWRIAVNDMRNASITPDDIPRAIRGYQATYPRARVTPLALVGHWAEIQEGKPHDLAQLEINRRAGETAARQKTERERADAERKAAEQREVQRLLSEYGYEDGR